MIESGASEQTPPRIKAEDNPWYLLATLYGVPEAADDKLKARNRIAWNRYFAAILDEETRTKLTEEKRHPAEELTPFSPEELWEVATALAERSKASAKKVALPVSNADIDFSNVEFEQKAFFEGYLFTKASFFQDVAFSGETSFHGATFSAEAYFECATFSALANFRGAAFLGAANFAVAAFFGVATFAGATFSAEAAFDGANFFRWVFFGRAAFSEKASFDGATFSGQADFGGANFSRWTFFGRAAFSDSANFRHAAFSGKAAFDGATFSGQADFEGAIFSGHTDFGEATFCQKSNFVNAEMKGETSFEGAKFEKEPPCFFGAKLHQGTVWRRIKWPLPKKKVEAGAFLDTYACLKLEMDRLKKHEDELDFFALELQSRRVLQESVLKGSGLPIALYGLVSDYGRSYARPLYALFVVVAIGALVLLLSGAVTPRQSPGLSIANTLNIFGFRKDFFDSHLIENLPAALKILAAVQTILGAILLFLFGLGVRNKFRMK